MLITSVSEPASDDEEGEEVHVARWKNFGKENLRAQPIDCGL